MQPLNHTTNLPPMTQLGGYQMIRALPGGRGTLAVAESGRQVVVKPLDPACLVNGDLHPDVRGRLNRIRELAASGVASLISVERGDNAAHLVWEWIEGQSMQDWLSAGPPREHRLLAAREIILLIESLHAAGIVHGALHGRNIIRDPRGKLWLTHLSPLLLSDAQHDIDAVAAILREILRDDETPAAASLRQMRLALVGLIESSDGREPAGQRNAESRSRRLTFLLAIGIALLAAAMSLAIWTWAH